MNGMKYLESKAKKYLSNEGYGAGSNFTVSSVSNLMAEYAAHIKAENLPIANVSECPNCGASEKESIDCIQCKVGGHPIG